VEEKKEERADDYGTVSLIDGEEIEIKFQC